MPFPWGDKILEGIRTQKLPSAEQRPLHDFLSAALMDADGNPQGFAGRDGFGRGDCMLRNCMTVMYDPDGTEVHLVSPLAYRVFGPTRNVLEALYRT